MAEDGPYFDDLTRGDTFDAAPAMTLTAGQVAVHQAILGDRLRLPLDYPLSAAVTGSAAPLAHPALVWDLAIGQSTLVTGHVVANLFYRGLVFARAPVLGDTLRTTTEVVALRQNRPRPGRRDTGLAALRISTVDQDGRAVLDFWRCAMLPLRVAGAATGYADDLDRVGAGADRPLAGAVRGWRLDRLAPSPAALAGRSWDIPGGDVVSSAPELARLTLNVAQVHHDEAAAGGRRLVYGGHTIGLALAQVTRALPDLVTVTAWHGCDHTGPVHEGDTLYGRLTVDRVEPLPAGRLAHLRSVVSARATAAAPLRPVLDWRFAAVLV